MDWRSWAIAQKKGLNQKEIAKHWGISEGAFTNLLYGRQPNTLTLIKIAKVRDVRVWELVKEVEEFKTPAKRSV